MSHFAQVTNGIVTNVIVIDEAPDSSWKQTSYNTRGGIHYGQDGQPDGGVALRGNYAGIGHIYDQVNDVFYGPRPYSSWSIAGPSWLWRAPVPMPSDGGIYIWNEAQLRWDIAP